MWGCIRAIFFDAGNTLIFPRLEEVARDLTTQGYPATVEDFYEAERQGKRKLDEWLWPQLRDGEAPRGADRVYWTAYLKALLERIGAPEPAHESLIYRLLERFRDITFWSVVVPGTVEFLDQLRAQAYYLGVISNSVGTVAEQLKRVDLERRFEIVLDSAIVGVEKPQPKIFHLALAHAGVQPTEALFVGDAYSTDIGGAQLAGWRGVLIDRVGAYPDAACPRITALPELEAILKSFD